MNPKMKKLTVEVTDNETVVDGIITNEDKAFIILNPKNSMVLDKMLEYGRNLIKEVRDIK